MYISMKNFGPISSGQLEVKPLTILIGANNSGKSFAAQLIYVLSRVLSAKVGSAYPFSRRISYREFMWRRLSEEATPTDYSDLPPEIKNKIDQEVARLVTSVQVGLHDALAEYFGVESVNALAQYGDESKTLSISLKSAERSPSLVEIHSRKRKKASIVVSQPDLNSLKIPLPSTEEDAREFGPTMIARTFAEKVWIEKTSAFGILDRSEYYLPSARSGILTAWPLVTAMALGVVRRRLGPDPISVEALSGVAGDFLQVLVSNFLDDRPPSGSRPKAFRGALDALENDMLRGKVTVEDSRSQQSLLMYKAAGLKVPVHRASSMVAEIAPLDLWIEQLLRPGDLLVIDEPEAHLHPANQRHMARVLVRLVNAGVRVVCPTHSSLITHQISNHILASQVPPSERRRLGFTDEDILDASKVGVYAFEASEGGTTVSSVPVTQDGGISEEEFAAVAEQIGDETYDLARSAETDDQEDDCD